MDYKTDLFNGKTEEKPVNLSTGRAKKRRDYLSWDDYFMGVAFLSAQRSKDPSTQVGACIVQKDMTIVGIGYNGMPWGCDDDELPWDRDGDSPTDTKYPYICHAEMNAVLNTHASLKECRIYTSLYPCNDCAKIIIQAGIREAEAARTILKMAGVKTRMHVPKQHKIVIDFTPPEVLPSYELRLPSAPI